MTRLSAFRHEFCVRRTCGFVWQYTSIQQVHTYKLKQASTRSFTKLEPNSRKPTHDRIPFHRIVWFNSINSYPYMWIRHNLHIWPPRKMRILFTYDNQYTHTCKSFFSPAHNVKIVSISTIACRTLCRMVHASADDERRCVGINSFGHRSRIRPATKQNNTKQLFQFISIRVSRITSIYLQNGLSWC